MLDQIASRLQIIQPMAQPQRQRLNTPHSILNIHKLVFDIHQLCARRRLRSSCPDVLYVPRKV